jgi:AbrB family looped-hinge helix DNA binding protein
MSLVTSKLQVTLPKAIADKYQIRPGDEIEWVEAGDRLHVVPAKTLPARLTTPERLRLFDEATERQRQREALAPSGAAASRASVERGWKREELYGRGRAR